MNNLDPEVAEDPEHLIVYGGTGRAARSWEAFDAIVRELRELENDETLLVASGKPVGVFRTTAEAPRVLIANANLVPHWATWEQFRELERAGLTMYGQMTAGSWIYIATQGIIQGTYETFAECARQHFDGSLAGRSLLTAGLGGMGGAQPLAATMNGGAVLVIEVDPARAQRRLDAGYVDELTNDLDDAIARVEAWKSEGTARSIALIGNAADIEPELVLRGWKPTSSRTRRLPTIRWADTSREASAWMRRSSCASAIPTNTRDAPWKASRRTCGRCSSSIGLVRSPSTTATTSASTPRRRA